ncbi:MAG: ABC transporter ATP-binding protein [Patescibacteria group bacterium]
MIVKNGIIERSETLVNLKNVTKIYGKGDLAFKALDGVNLGIKKGEFSAVIGPSGSGKTTLLNMIGALDKPTSGEIFLEDLDISKIKESKLYRIRREKIGFIFQSYYLIPTLNVLQNIIVPSMPLKTKKEDYLQKAKELLARVGMRGKEKRRPSQLSGGEQQRVAIARALIINPLLILADEPTGNLDTKTGGEIIKLMQDLNKREGKTFVIVTHDQRITQFCQRVIQLQDGKII